MDETPGNFVSAFFGLSPFCEFIFTVKRGPLPAGGRDFYRIFLGDLLVKKSEAVNIARRVDRRRQELAFTFGEGRVY